MSTRTASKLAWGLCVLSLALTALSLLLLILNLSHPNTHLYEPWLDNTLTAVFYPTVGALVASRRPENPVGWLLCLYGLAISISYSWLVRKSLPVFTAIDSPVLSEKWPLGICAAVPRSLHCYRVVLAKGREENPYLQCCQPETKHNPTHTRK